MCSQSRRRAANGSKRMYLDYTHGLFITQTEFRLSTTFIPIIIIIYNWYLSINSVTPIYTQTQVTIYSYTWRIPLALISPCWFPLSSPLYPLLLTWNPPSCDRNRPPQSQVACKLTPPIHYPANVPSHPKSRPLLGFPRSNVHSIRTTLRTRPISSQTIRIV